MQPKCLCFKVVSSFRSEFIQWGSLEMGRSPKYHIQKTPLLHCLGKIFLWKWLPCFSCPPQVRDLSQLFSLGCCYSYSTWPYTETTKILTLGFNSQRFLKIKSCEIRKSNINPGLSRWKDNFFFKSGPQLLLAVLSFTGIRGYFLEIPGNTFAHRNICWLTIGLLT